MSVIVQLHNIFLRQDGSPTAVLAARPYPLALCFLFLPDEFAARHHLGCFLAIAGMFSTQAPCTENCRCPNRHGVDVLSLKRPLVLVGVSYGTVPCRTATTVLPNSNVRKRTPSFPHTKLTDQQSKVAVFIFSDLFAPCSCPK